MTSRSEAQGRWSRRQVLTTIGAGSAVAAGGAGVALALRRSEGGAEQAFSSQPAVRLAMHTHGSWSEGWGSWEGHFGEAAAAEMDVLFMTDHEHQAQAVRFLSSLAGAAWERDVSASAARKTLTATPSGQLRLLVESADGRAASATLRIQPQPCAKDRLRTSISGLRIDHTFGQARLDQDARYEIRLELSQHPAARGRPAGRFALVYRFGAPGRSRFVQGGGLVGVVAAPLPPAGTTVRLSPETDVDALWPTMWAPDNSIYGLSFTVISSRAGSAADVKVTSVAMPRERNAPSAVTADQQAIIAEYGPRYPGLSARLSTEIGRFKMHMNPFGVPQLFPDFALDTPSNHDAFFTDLVADVHAAGGAMSLNHPFGYDAEPLLPAAQQAELRRSTFRALSAQSVYGVDILEVGYAIRGHVDIGTHLALWDTFSRNGYFLTGNGANDDHSGEGWRTLRNGFFTGAWAASHGDADLVTALRSGRAFCAHLGAWPQASLDLRLDDGVPMGSALVSTASKHRLAIAASSLPAGASVEVISGPADFSGAADPGTSLEQVLSPSAFVRGVARTSVATDSSRFCRVQVKDGSGAIIATSNPIWIVRSTSEAAIPPNRRA